MGIRQELSDAQLRVVLSRPHIQKAQEIARLVRYKEYHLGGKWRMGMTEIFANKLSYEISEDLIWTGIRAWGWEGTIQNGGSFLGVEIVFHSYVKDSCWAEEIK